MLKNMKNKQKEWHPATKPLILFKLVKYCKPQATFFQFYTSSK